MLETYLGEGKTGDVRETNPACQRLRNALDQVGGCAPEQKKDGPTVGVVENGPQRFEERRHALDFVHDDQALAGAQNGLRGGGERLANGADLEVEYPGGPLPRLGNLPRQRRLADLPGAEESDRGRFPKALPDRVQ